MTCRICGTVLDPSGTCPRCAQGAGDETVRIETIALAAAAAAATTPTSEPGTSPSRFHMTDFPDEGRFPPGTLVAGRYRIVGLLGRGGMGEVYRATDLTLAQPVALKFLPEDAVMNQRILERFHNEVRIARQVSHPNVCRVYDIGEAEGLPFISMEYVDGEDLSCLLARIGRLPGDKALEIARKLCAGIAAAHSRGIIHRDLKPQNVMLNRRGEVVIMDFGLAAIADELRGPESRNGTPAYMAPEQLRGEAVSTKSDIYALGLLIFELFTGRRAFDARNMADLLHAQESDRPVSLSSLVTDADPQVEKAILRCLRPDPAERPATAMAVAAALPGGDPLAAALAAGETPSPELVAASGKTHAVPARYAVTCAVLCGIVLIAMVFMMQKIALLALVPAELPPAVLEQKAREIAESLGHKPARRDYVSWFYANGDLVTGIGATVKGSQNWVELLKGESPYRLSYRQSPRYLLSPPDGTINAERPPNTLPGMLLVNVDGAGRLRHLEAVIGARQKMPENPPDTGSLFRAAGLDLNQFQETAPILVPKIPFDSLKAWKGRHPGLTDVDIIVHAATWKGTPVSFQIVWPWATLPDEPEKPVPVRVRALQSVQAVLLSAGLLCAIYFARHNLRAGRGDRQGATRLAVFVVILKLAIRLLQTHFVPDLQLAGFLFQQAAAAVAEGIIVWLVYIALEPIVRRTWPHTLITWNRLLAGQWMDARLAWHILIGVAAGLAVRGSFMVRQYVNMSTSTMLWPSTDLLRGPALFLSGWISMLENAVQMSLVIFFLLCGLKAILRRDWLAALVAGVLVSLQEGEIRNSPNLPLDLTVYVGIIGCIAYLLLRVGLVPSIVSILIIDGSAKIQTSPEFTAWFNAPAIVSLLLIASIIIFACWASQRSTLAVPQRE